MMVSLKKATSFIGKIIARWAMLAKMTHMYLKLLQRFTAILLQQYNSEGIG